MNNSDSSFGQKEVDNLLDTYEIKNDNHIITVDEYDVKNKNEKRYIAEFEYQDVHYQLKGIIKKQEIDDILKKLYFSKKNA